ncbi:hypothetical protein CY35_14G042700 [Sphagnum magellanicum]|nr:hypothetical protein CY35_14G042700 [Sphagnum magellanicum]KAH9541106.1 hypothetical protein CY35_14G042700 [Sphagnum magellanicum]KAH9541107.1 hypothetical protein CY35_14G042700 [Sphagnum magellanicum]
MPALVGSPLAISLVLHKPPSAYFVCGASPVRHVCVEGGGICLRAKKRWQRREPKSSSRRSSSSSSSRSVVGMVRCSSGLQQQFPVPVVSGFGAPLPRLQDLDPSTMLLQQRILFLGSQVDDFTADVIISQLLLLDAQDPTKDIKLFINSPGGSVTAGMGIYDAMKLCRADVSTVCFGLAASMGAFLLAAGSKGKRYCMPNARVMIHQPLGGAGGSAIDVGLQVREMMYHKVKLTKIMSRLTGKSEEQIEEDTDRDYFMNAWEAKEYGIVDGVIDDGKPGLVAPIGEIKEPPKSRIWDYWTIKEGKERKLLPSEERPAPKEASEEREPTAV